METIDQGEREQMARALAFLQEHEGIIRAALGSHARRMREDSVAAKSEYERGQKDPEVKAAQDNSLMTNFGFKHASALFMDSAESAEDASRDLSDVMLGL
ncbi:hypothetical protein AB5J55_22375 [Streptomyces sp. R11]|uniref:PE domain-containing protein n=1 Tax=Streptomyces sp. R11 TaxID=3238625 RepID=A0AB39N5G6_9ACTN